MNKRVFFLSLVVILKAASPASAQLNQFFNGMFNKILRDDLKLSQIGHGRHFFEAADRANLVLTPTLNSMIAGNVSSFPLSSTVAGITFDFSSGQPVSLTESLGPIFAETGETLGKGKINVGVIATNLNLEKFRGLPTQQMRFAFTHNDVSGSGILGDRREESDVLDVGLGLESVNANIVAIFATKGITDNLDLGVAIPIIHLSLRGNAKASFTSFTLRQKGTADHTFPDNQLAETVSYHENAIGFGDIALRLKYSFLRNAGINVAALLDLRLLPGDNDDFLSTGKQNFKLSWILSKSFGSFSPHLNVGYDRRTGFPDSDEFEFVAGFDQKITTGVTFAAALLGEYDLDKNEALAFGGTVDIVDHDKDLEKGGRVIGTRSIDFSNIPTRKYDNLLNASIGLRIAPSERFSFLGNALISLNDGGLRTRVAPTFGLTMTF